MPPTIHCIRHGQGFHNVGVGFYNLPDPKLTPLGVEQCLALRARSFQDQSHISLITTSPLTRTIESTFIIFQPSLQSTGDSPKTILALPDAQETSDDPCDIGSDIDVLRSSCEANHWPVDLSLVTEGYNIKTLRGRYSPGSQAIANRARDVRLFLRDQARRLIASGTPDPEIVLVTHGGFLHYFTEDWEDADKFPGTGWVNCETRSYTFEHGVDSEDDVDANLVETMTSRQGRELEYPMFSKERQRDVYVQAMQGWEDQGLQNPAKMDLGGEEDAS